MRCWDHAGPRSHRAGYTSRPTEGGASSQRQHPRSQSVLRAVPPDAGAGVWHELQPSGHWIIVLQRCLGLCGAWVCQLRLGRPVSWEEALDLLRQR